MSYGTFSFGTRAFGGSTAGTETPAGLPGAAVLAGGATFSGTAATGGKYGQALLAGVGTIAPTGLTMVEGFALLEGRATFVGTTPFLQTADPSQQKIQYRAVVVDHLGNKYADLNNAHISHVTWELNGIHSCEFSLPSTDPKAVHLKAPEREVQIWRGNQLVAWFVMTSIRADGTNLVVQCKGLRWYFTRRFFGKADRTNYVPNGSFETGMGGWNVFYSPIEPASNLTFDNFTLAIVTNRNVTGRKSVKITDTTGPAPIYGIQFFTDFEYTVSDEIDPEGTIWTLAAWIYVEQFITSTVPSHIRLSRYSTTQTIEITRPGGTPVTYPKPLGSIAIPIDEDTPRNTWVRMEIEVTQPFRADEPELVQVAIVAPRGIIYIDEVTLTAAEKTAFYDKDQAEIISGIIDHAQDPAYGKSTFNIGKNIPMTGIIRTREFWHSEHQNIGDALDEFASLYQGVDSEIEITPTSRIYTTYYPRKGIERPSVALEYGRNIATFTVENNGEETANSVVVLGDGEGSDREEGGYVDATALVGGLILEKVYNATPGSHIKTLDQQAVRGVERFKKPVVIPQVTTFDNRGYLIETLRVGDVVPLRILQMNQVPFKFLYLPSTGSDYATTPDQSSLDITGGLDVRVYDVAANDWTPPNFMGIVGKWTDSGGSNHRSFLVQLRANGFLRLYTSTTGADFPNVDSPAVIWSGLTGFVDGSPVNFGVQRAAGGGAGSVQWLRSVGDDPLAAWGSPMTIGAGSLFSSTAPLTVGAYNAGSTAKFAGRIGRVEVRDGVGGTVVASPNFAGQVPGITSFQDAQGNVWTLNGGAVIDTGSKAINGFVQINENYRIMAMSVDPETDQITFTINPAATSF